MTELVRRKRRLVLETPYRVRGRALIVNVEAAGLKLREKGCQGEFRISWAQVYNRAAEIAVERARLERQRRRKSAKINLTVIALLAWRFQILSQEEDTHETAYAGAAQASAAALCAGERGGPRRVHQVLYARLPLDVVCDRGLRGRWGLRVLGYVCGSENESGYFRLSELEAARGPLGLAIERDLYFEPTPGSKLQQAGFSPSA